MVDMTRVPPWKRNLGMVFQHYAIFPHMNVAENIGYGLRLRKLPKDEIREKVGHLLKLVGLAGMEQRAVIRLSGGEQQRVALPRSLALAPDLLFLDEPFINLDPIYQNKVQKYLKDYTNNGGTIFMCTHLLEIAEKLCTRIAILDHGKIVGLGNIASLRKTPKEDLSDIFMRLVKSR